MGVRRLSILLAVLYLIAGTLLLGDFGPTLDSVHGEYGYGEKVLQSLSDGDRDFLKQGPPDASRLRQPHPHFTGAFEWFDVFGKFGSLLSALSCQVLWTELGVLPALSAHHFVIVLLTAVLVLVVAHFAGTRLGIIAGAGAALLMVTSPRFFAHSLHNLKDAPEAVLYSFAALAAYRAFTGDGKRWWVFTGVLTALALGQKPNTLFVPVHVCLFLGVWLLYWLARRKGEVRFSWQGVVVATLVFAVAYIAINPAYWSDTFAQLSTYYERVTSDGNLGLNAIHQAAGLGGGEVNWWSVRYSLYTTPPAVLVLALIGIFAPGCKASLRIFLVTWIATIFGRTLIPGTLNHDGVRHFLEIYPAYCILAGHGLATLVRIGDRLLRARPESARRWLRAAALGLAVGPGLVMTALTHPNGICYFNFSVGGLKGAQEKLIPDATDYWGNSYWQGLDWLNAHADADAGLLVPVYAHIVECAAPVKLRGDITLGKHTDAPPRVLYVMYVRRWFGQYARELDEANEPVHEITVQGGPILRVHRFEGDRAKAEFELWAREVRANEARNRFFKELVEKKKDAFAEVMKCLWLAGQTGSEAAATRLRELAPESVHDAIDDVLWLQLGDLRKSLRSDAPREGKDG